ncbi:hypothetical protein BN946_scf184748.g13 [Trametes cinnabarina]|uniref:Eisosome component PIL1-domain-containing protein n=1 Tax=Pycnoporus cinnabarinus TaxID=5643 RepID=A0A060S8N5_PYCCI|nr:hypothetical protein BN946_scf184748.g13 [Trametes cinnabarina]
MFKTAARKLAHNTTVPGLPGLSAKQDLRALQDLITAEKGIMNSLQRLSADFTKAAEALKIWGLGEGDDLSDTLSASTTLLLHFSSALAVYASHEVTVREHMKAVRSREESLDELKRRRRSLFSDAESAERKLSKMSPEHKNLQQQTDLLNKLRDEIRVMDTDIMTEEARLGDFKRSSARHLMGLKFGGLLECCEKGAIVGELGKLVIAEIPTAPTEPGLPRPYYTGHARTEFLVAEAARTIAEVVYSPDPNPNPSHRSIRPLPGSELPAVPSPFQRRMSAASVNGPPGFPIPTSPPGTYMGLPQVEESGFNIQGFMSPDQPHSPLSQNPPVNEFGTYAGGPVSPQVNSLGAIDRDKASSPRGGRFATFPVKAAGPRPPPGATGGSSISTNPYIAPPLRDGDRAPSLDIDRNDESFSSSIAQALGGKIDIDNDTSQTQGASGSSSRFSAPSVPPPQDVKGPDFAPQRYSPPPPMYTPASSNGNKLPAGAAPPNPPSSLQAIAHDTQAAGSRPSSTAEDVGLAYMSGDRADESNESTSESGDRRVRFGGVSDVDQEMEKRHAQEEAAAQRTPSPPPSQADVPSQEQARGSFEAPRLSQPGPPTSHAPPADYDRGRSSFSQQRIPSPPPQQQQQQQQRPAQDPLDEHSLNAAAAREVSRELDALMMSSPVAAEPPSPNWTQPPRPQYTNPYQRRAISPRPSLDPASGGAPQTTSPKLEGMYVRQRDRSASSPISRVPVPESGPPPASPSGSNDGSDQMQQSIHSIPRISPAPTTGSTGTPFRTPLETPLAPPNTGSLYNLAGSTGSNSSFSAVPTGVRTISAAAFRRPVRNASGSVVSEGGRQSPGPADITPLNVKKRPLPNSPYPPPHPSANLQAPGGMMRSVSAPGGPGGPEGEQGSQDPGQRPLTHYRQDDDFDYISAYTDGQEGGKEGNAPGYHQGRFATNLDEGNGVL